MWRLVGLSVLVSCRTPAPPAQTVLPMSGFGCVVDHPGRGFRGTFDDATATIHGTVVDKQHKPLGEISVAFSLQTPSGPRAFPSVYSDDEGGYSIAVQPGKYDVTFWYGDTKLLEKTVVATSGARIEVGDDAVTIDGLPGTPRCA
ncbi:MAG TPA: carboxypeptidase-like regulatory domain-containing protein [Kofleriaceae bacterium]|jgi:hypothetical protein